MYLICLLLIEWENVYKSKSSRFFLKKITFWYFNFLGLEFQASIKWLSDGFNELLTSRTSLGEIDLPMSSGRPNSSGRVYIVILKRIHCQLYVPWTMKFQTNPQRKWLIAWSVPLISPSSKFQCFALMGFFLAFCDKDQNKYKVDHKDKKRNMEHVIDCTFLKVPVLVVFFVSPFHSFIPSNSTQLLHCILRSLHFFTFL